jgi:hypothetical protein
MRKQLFSLAVVVAALAMLVQSADAGSRRDKRLVAASVVTGAAATVAYFSITDWRWRNWNYRTSSGLTAGGAYIATTVGCMAASPIIGTLVVNRPLTAREVHTMMGGCVIPIIGGLLVDAAYEANPQWEAGYAAPARPVRHTRKRR